MFNIVKRRDFMLGRNVATKTEAEEAAQKYGAEYVAVATDYGDPPPTTLETPPLTAGTTPGA